MNDSCSINIIMVGACNLLTKDDEFTTSDWLGEFVRNRFLRNFSKYRFLFPGSVPYGRKIFDSQEKQLNSELKLQSTRWYKWRRNLIKKRVISSSKDISKNLIVMSSKL